MVVNAAQVGVPQNLALNSILEHLDVHYIAGYHYFDHHQQPSRGSHGFTLFCLKVDVFDFHYLSGQPIIIVVLNVLM